MDMNERQKTQVVDRQARIAEIRREIAAGTYETPARLEAAVDLFLEASFAQSRRIRGAKSTADATGVEFLE
jgi:hypothetical protein